MEQKEVQQEAAEKVTETLSAGTLPQPPPAAPQHRTWEFFAAVFLPIGIISLIATGIWYHDSLVKDRFEGPARPVMPEFEIEEATIGAPLPGIAPTPLVSALQYELQSGRLTSRALVQFYLHRIALHDPLLHAFIELNPDALAIADEKDLERTLSPPGALGPLHGIPIALKDNIGTRDKLNTTAGSFALLGSVVARDSSVVRGLRAAGMIILGKANMNEWAGIRSTNEVVGWSARGGTTKNPYLITASPCGSSGGSAVAVAANLATVALGTETDGSILCPSGRAALVGLKPTVGLTSRAGVVPITLSQDSVGPMARFLEDAVVVLDAMVAREVDPLDPATATCHHTMPSGSYREFLDTFGCQGKRIGYIVDPFWTPRAGGGVSEEEMAVQNTHLRLLEALGATLVELHLGEGVADAIMKGTPEFPETAERVVMVHEFKAHVAAYLASLEASPHAASLEDLVAFNEEHREVELGVMNQELFHQAVKSTGLKEKAYLRAKEVVAGYVVEAVDKQFEEHKLDAIVGPTNSKIYKLAAIGGYPGITIPAGYSGEGVPFGLTFIARSCMEPQLIQIASAFEAATTSRKVPTFLGIETSGGSSSGDGMCANPDGEGASCTQVV